MIFGSVCSGIEAASVAWEPLGFQPAWFAEIEQFPSAVLARRYPAVRNLGDMTKIAAMVRSGLVAAPDVLVGGTPCQAFSVAGARAGLADPRGQLTLAYVDLANAIDATRSVLGADPCAIVWENVPGVLSSADNAFGCFLAALAGEERELEPAPRPAAGKSSRRWKWSKTAGKHIPSWPNAGCVYGPQRAVAWRVLDAQYFGLAKRRRRVFVVASALHRFDPAEVLFEFDGVRRDSAPSREAGQEAAAGTLRSTDSGSNVDHARAGRLVAGTLGANHGNIKAEHAWTGQLVVHGGVEAVCVTGDITHTLKAEGFDASEDGTGRGQPIVPVHAFQSSQSGVRISDVHATLDANNGPRRHNGALVGMQVRRLMPVECERLQGFADGHTDVPVRGRPAADGPRYKALGNSMATHCMAWIGRRLLAALAL